MYKENWIMYMYMYMYMYVYEHLRSYWEIYMYQENTRLIVFF